MNNTVVTDINIHNDNDTTKVSENISDENNNCNHNYNYKTQEDIATTIMIPTNTTVKRPHSEQQIRPSSTTYKYDTNT